MLLSVLGCNESSTTNGDQSESASPGLHRDNEIVVDGATRNYDYYIPGELQSDHYPMLLLLHGGGSNTDDLTGMSGFKAPYKIWMEIAVSEGIILVYPEGSVNPMGELGWNDCRSDATTNPSVDDTAFIEALIERFSDDFPIDRHRIYANGTSNGGHMSLRLALELSDRIAAVAPVVAAMPSSSGCTRPNQPISVLFMNGTQDPILPYQGGEVAPSIGGRGTVLSAQASMAYWTDFNKTDPVPQVVIYPDISKVDSTSVKRTTYAGGVEGTQVVLYEVIDGGHVEPSIREQYSFVAEAYLGRQNHDIEMAQEIWNFFEDKTL